MATISLRQANVYFSTGNIIVNAPLTNAQVDNNFANLNIAVINVEANVGSPTNLTTQFKGNVIYAINELRGNLTTSAGLAGLLGDETGTGNFVMNTSPTFAGTPQSITAANATANAMIATTQFVANSIQYLANTISPSFTGTPQSITAANATANAMVATTQFVANAIQYLANTNSPTLTTPTINSATLNLSTSNFATLVNPTLVSAFERANIRNEAPSATVNMDLLDSRGGVVFFTSNTTANIIVNLRANATTSLDSWLGSTASNANVATGVLVVINGATQYYVNNVTIDGRIMHNSSIKGNLFWQGNTLSSGGTAAAIDAYTFTVIKNGGSRGGASYGGNVYTILAAQTNFKSFLA